MEKSRNFTIEICVVNKLLIFKSIKWEQKKELTILYKAPQWMLCQIQHRVRASLCYTGFDH